MREFAPVIDITSLNGVESLFTGGPRDPFAKQLAGRLADFVIYSDVARFTMPTFGVAEAAGDKFREFFGH